MALRIDGRLRSVRWLLIARCRLLVPKYDMRCTCVRSLLMDWGDATSEMLSRVAKMYLCNTAVHGNDATLAGDFGNTHVPCNRVLLYAIDYVLCDGHYTADVTLLRRLE